MKKLKIGTLLILLPILCSAQLPDSVRIIPVQKWKLDRLLQSHFYILPSCDSTVTHYQKALQLADSTIHSANKVILVRTEQRDLKVLESYTWEQRFSNQKTIHEQEIKSIKRQKLNMTFIAIGEAILLILILLKPF